MNYSKYVSTCGLGKNELWNMNVVSLQYNLLKIFILEIENDIRTKQWKMKTRLND
jgi:hypothetical protein